MTARTAPARSDASPPTGVILVGHGAVARDMPRALLTELKALERRQAELDPPEVARLAELEERIRSWPRTPDNDPHKRGLERLAGAMRAKLVVAPVLVAFNELCAPTLEQAIAQLVAHPCERIKVLSAMITPGGKHATFDIPESLARARRQHPEVQIQYAWPMDLDAVAELFVEQLGKRGGWHAAD